METDRTPGAAAPLLGRDLPLATLAATLADARAGTRGVVLVEGEPGIGKTSLLRAALDGAAAVVVWAAGDEAEVDVDHGLIEQLVRAAPLPGDQRKELLASIGDDPLRTGAALVGLVDGLQIDPARPLVVVVDDAQWADLPSLQALTFAARRLRRDPVVLCMAVRTDGIGHLPDGLLRLATDQGTGLRLGPLERADVRQLVAGRSGVTISAVAADRLLAHTQGNPLHLQTLLDELPPAAVTAPGDLPSPRSFSMLVLSRLASCTPRVEALVTAAAVLGDPALLADVAALAGLDDPLPALDEAIEHGLLAVNAPDDPPRSVAVAFAHPLVRAAVLGDLAPGRLAHLHRLAAEVVEGTAGLRHRLRGAVGPDASLWQDAVQTAEEHASGAPGASAALLREAARVAPTAEARDRALLDAVDRFLLAGRLEDAEALRPALDAAQPSALRSYVQGRLAYVAGPRRTTREHLADAWARLVAEADGDEELTGRSPDERRLAGRVAAMRATACVDRGAGEDAIRWGRRALALAPIEAALASTGHMLAGAHALTGQLEEGEALLDELCARVDAVGPDAASGALEADVHCGRGLLRLWCHDLVGAAEDLEHSLDAAARGGSFVARESARFYLAEVRYRQGRWDDAIVLAQQSASVVDDADQGWMAALPHATAARPLAGRGEAAAEEHLDRAVAAAEAVGAGVGIGLARVAALEVAACRRDHQMVAALGDLLVGQRRVPVDERIAPWRAGYVEALVALDRALDAAPVVEQLRAMTPTPVIVNDLARAEVAVAAVAGDDAAVDAAAEIGLDADPDAVGPYPRARLELAVGRAWRRRGDRRRAQAVLEQAHLRLSALGAVPWLEQVEREIAASGLRPAGRADRTGTELTPQEQAVAQLVARGLTNREVGAELVVSAKTVEHHLSRIYAKLGLRSRTELARALRPPET